MEGLSRWNADRTAGAVSGVMTGPETYSGVLAMAGGGVLVEMDDDQQRDEGFVDDSEEQTVGLVPEVFSEQDGTV